MPYKGQYYVLLTNNSATWRLLPPYWFQYFCMTQDKRHRRQMDTGKGGNSKLFFVSIVNRERIYSLGSKCFPSWEDSFSWGAVHYKCCLLLKNDGKSTKYIHSPEVLPSAVGRNTKHRNYTYFFRPDSPSLLSSISFEVFFYGAMVHIPLLLQEQPLN